MRAPRIPAKDVKVGDLILTAYAPRTWQYVEAVRRERWNGDADQRTVMIDTPTTRLWYPRDQPIACKQRPRPRKPLKAIEDVF